MQKKTVITANFQYKAIVVLLITLGIILIATRFSASQPPAQLDNVFNVTKLYVITPSGNVTQYWAYLALNSSQQREGYMNQTDIGDCRSNSPCIGMLFVFNSTASECFWMKNTKIPLQMSWITVNYTVVAVYNATPESISTECSIGEAVLETAPGSVVKVGDRVSPTP